MNHELTTINQKLRTHIAKHWYNHLAIWGVLLSGLILGAGGTVAARHFCRSAGAVGVSICAGGYQPGPLPPPFTLGGVGSPVSFSLSRYILRVHNQGSYWSCVGQTLALIEEITERERGHHDNFSSGFIWNQLNGGNPEGGVSYADAFRILLQQGDARLRDFAPDGYADATVLPDERARRAALPYRFQSWGSIEPTDRSTIQAEISSGRPIAIAIHAYSGFANLWAGYQSLPVVDGDVGSYLFDHSVTGIGYTPAGVIIQNSYGPSWGYEGRALLTWNYLATTGTYIVGAEPGHPPSIARKGPAPTRPGQKPQHTPVPTPSPTPTPGQLDCSSPLAGGEKLCVLRPEHA